jgi:hypothetical protein
LKQRAGFWTFVILFVVKKIPLVGLTTSAEKQEAGLDSVYHKELAYSTMEGESVYSKSSVMKQNSVYKQQDGGICKIAVSYHFVVYLRVVTSRPKVPN